MDTQERPQKPLPIVIYAGVVAILLIAIIWVASSGDDQVVAEPTPVVVTPTISPEIEMEPEVASQSEVEQSITEPVVDEPEVIEEPEVAQVTVEPEPVEPAHPPLRESDPWFRSQLTDLVMGAPAIRKVVQENVISNFVVFVDNAAKGNVMRSFSPVTEPTGKFKAKLLDGAELTYVLDSESYKRYDLYADLITALPISASGDLYETIQPLIEEAYMELGYSENDFDEKLIETIDLLIATPIIDGEIKLVTPSAMFQFADPKLESLAPIQKLFIRMGPTNQRKIVPVLNDFKAWLLDG